MRFDEHIGGGETVIFREKFEDRMRRIRMAGRAVLGLALPDDAPWYVLCVQTGRERETGEAVRECGAEVLVPMRKGKQRKRRGRILPAVDEVLMVGYVLVRTAGTAEAMSGLMSFERVVGVLGGWEHPFPVSTGRVQDLIGKASGGRYDWDRECSITVRAGELVRISEGLFGGNNAVVITPNGQGKGDVVVEVEMFGQKTPVIFPLVMLEKL